MPTREAGLPPIGGDGPGHRRPDRPDRALRRRRRQLSATSWVVADLDTGEVLGACAPHQYGAPASVQKLLLAATFLPKLDPQAGRHGHRRGPEVRAGQLGRRPGARRQVQRRDALARAAAQLRQRRGERAGPARRRQRRRGGRGGGDERRGPPARGVRHARGDAVRTGRSGTGHQRVRPGAHRPGLLRAGRLPPVRGHEAGPDARRSRPRTSTGSRSRTRTGCSSSTRVRWAARPGSPTWPGTPTSARPQRNGRRLVVTLLGRRGQPVRAWQQGAALLDWGFAVRPGRGGRPAGRTRARRRRPLADRRTSATPSATPAAPVRARGRTRLRAPAAAVVTVRRAWLWRCRGRRRLARADRRR